ncbi:OadG-related small transporter subunit [Sporanaerobium hydrogeniformans]|nr:OadG-related small transporter subunit [Sporanaerobium hydrogeniformans]
MNLVNEINALILMGKGMLAIFTVIIIIFIIITALIKFLPNEPTEKN